IDRSKPNGLVGRQSVPPSLTMTPLSFAQRGCLSAPPCSTGMVAVFYGRAYLARFQVSVGTNGPSGEGIGARAYVMSSPLMLLIVAFCSVPSKFGFVEP